MERPHGSRQDLAHLVVAECAGDSAAPSDAARTFVGVAMTIELRLTRHLFTLIHENLSRAHAHAWERVCFLSCRSARLRENSLLLLGRDLHPVADGDYEE